MMSRAPDCTRSTTSTRRAQGSADTASGRDLAAALIPPDRDRLDLLLGGGDTVRLTDLRKVIWTDSGLTKGDLLRYYASVAPVLLPHLRDRTVEIKRYPDGAAGACLFARQAPDDTPAFVPTCAIDRGDGERIDVAVARDLPALLWHMNRDGIELNPSVARCDDIDRPDHISFDLDPTPGATFARVLEAALAIRGSLAELGMPSYVKTSGARGVHIHVPLARGPRQKEVWTFAKAVANILALQQPSLLTSELRAAERPRDRVLIGYDQNARGRGLASIYSVRATPNATVSTPVSWDEVEAGFSAADHRLETVPARVERLGDVWLRALDPDLRVKLDDIV